MAHRTEEENGENSRETEDKILERLMHLRHIEQYLEALDEERVHGRVQLLSRLRPEVYDDLLEYRLHLRTLKQNSMNVHGDAQGSQTVFKAMGIEGRARNQG